MKMCNFVQITPITSASIGIFALGLKDLVQSRNLKLQSKYILAKYLVSMYLARFKFMNFFR